MDIQTIPEDPAQEALSGEDFDRLNEVAPRLMRELASGANLTINYLRKLALGGALTSSVLLGRSELEI